MRITDTSRLLKLMKDDARAIFTAAAKASEAVAYLKRLQPEADAPELHQQIGGWPSLPQFVKC